MFHKQQTSTPKYIMLNIIMSGLMVIGTSKIIKPSGMASGIKKLYKFIMGGKRNVTMNTINVRFVSLLKMSEILNKGINDIETITLFTK